MSLTLMDNGGALGSGEREWPEWTKHPMRTEARAKQMQADDNWAYDKCRELGIFPSIMNRLFVLISRDNSLNPNS